MRPFFKNPFKNSLQIALLVGISFFTNCKEKETPKLNPEQEQAKSVETDRKEANDNYQSVQEIAEKAMEDSQVQAREASTRQNKNFDTYPFTAYNQSGCASVTISGASTTPGTVGYISRTITLDFGTQGCIGTDGRTRKGKVIYNYSRPATPGAFNPFHSVGTIITTTFDNHYVNNIKLEGTTKHICKSFSFAQNTITKSDSVIVTGGKLIYSDGSSQLWACSQKRNLFVQLDNNFNPNLSSATFTLSGTTNGTNRQGIVYNTLINDTNTDRCLWKLSCPQFTTPSIEPSVFDPVVLPVQGKMTLSFGQNTALFDFGSGVCDSQYSLTINGVTTIVSI